MNDRNQLESLFTSLLRTIYSNIEYNVYKKLFHVDIGSNIHICNDKKELYDIIPSTSGVKQVSGSTIRSNGIGVIIIQFSTHI